MVDLFIRTKTRQQLIEILTNVGFNITEDNSIYKEGSSIYEIGYLSDYVGLDLGGLPIYKVNTDFWCTNIRSEDNQLQELLEDYQVFPETPRVVWAGGLNG